MKNIAEQRNRTPDRINAAVIFPIIEKNGYLYGANTEDTSVLCGSKRFDRVFFSEFFRAEKGSG